MAATLTAESVEAELIHEAAIGKIAGEQIEKLMTLGLTRTEAEAEKHKYEIYEKLTGRKWEE